MPTPVGRVAGTYRPGCRQASEYSISKAVTGWTLWARRRFSAPTSETPR
ncbi:MAG: hypothetical protein P4L50_20100 [Anaerolineaceae bacterium]|nr:hypothetical protein [Anaerolineaceae bacterium]